jgi:hypothetical protein
MATDTDIQKPDTLENGDGKKVELTPEQQEHVNRVFDTRFAKIQKKHEEAMQKMQAELEALKTNKTEEKPDGKPHKDDEESPEKKEYKKLLEAEKNRAKLAEAERQKAIDEAKSARAESMRVKKENAIAKSASKQNFYELETVSKLVWDNIEFDEDLNTFVVKDGGHIRQNSSLVPMTLEEYFSEFAAQRPYLVNGDVKSGAGSDDANKGGSMGLVKSKADLKTAKDKSDFITKFGLQKFEDLPAKL